jgi:plasmid stabilization system protein ParE
MEHDTARESLRLAIVTAARRLGANPMLGRAAAAPLPAAYRLWSVTRFGYLLVYDPATDPVQILRCVHTRRDLPRVLADLRDLPEPDPDPRDPSVT